jgi:Zn-finger protein
MVLDKYIITNADKIITGQNSNGIWYCKECHAGSSSESKQLMSEMNSIFNELNAEQKKENENVIKIKKDKKTSVDSKIDSKP